MFYTFWHIFISVPLSIICLFTTDKPMFSKISLVGPVATFVNKWLEIHLDSSDRHAAKILQHVWASQKKDAYKAMMTLS